MFGLGLGELLVVGLLVLLFFGGNRLPKLGASLGQSISNFKKGLNGKDESTQKTLDGKDTKNS